MSLRVLALTRYDTAGASSRVRVYQYLPWLAERGIDVVVDPLLGGDYLARLYAQRPTDWGGVMRAYARRAWGLWRRSPVDLLWIEYELLPWLPWALERQLVPAGVPYVVEYDDAVFHRYDLGSPVVRALLGRKLDHLMASSACVIAGNAYLAARARAAGAARVEVVPSVVDLRDYSFPDSRQDEPPPHVPSARSSAAAVDEGAQVAEPLRRPARDNASFTVGWLGSPSTTRYIQSLAEVFARVAASGPLRVVVVGGATVRMPDVALQQRAWSKETEAADIRTFDVGVMPLEDSPWERGKCGYKLIQYMACGRPVVASPVGVNTTLAIPTVTGMLASTPAEWVRALELLRGDAALRLRLGRQGRALVEREYALQVTAPRMADLLRDVASRNLGRHPAAAGRTPEPAEASPSARPADDTDAMPPSAGELGR